MAYDMVVVQTAHATALSMGASHKVLLALFEAAIVESGFRNLNYGDRDSVGFLQQRPSMGWPNPMDVPTATRSFVSRAMAKENNYATSGQLAQAVQISAFPLKYDAVKASAEALLASVGGSTATASFGDGYTQLGLGDTYKGLEKMLKTLARGDFWKLIGVFTGGLFLVGFALRSQLGKVVGV